MGEVVEYRSMWWSFVNTNWIYGFIIPLEQKTLLYPNSTTFQTFKDFFIFLLHEGGVWSCLSCITPFYTLFKPNNFHLHPFLSSTPLRYPQNLFSPGPRKIIQPSYPWPSFPSFGMYSSFKAESYSHVFRNSVDFFVSIIKIFTSIWVLTARSFFLFSLLLWSFLQPQSHFTFFGHLSSFVHCRWSYYISCFLCIVSSILPSLSLAVWLLHLWHAMFLKCWHSSPQNLSPSP